MSAEGLAFSFKRNLEGVSVRVCVHACVRARVCLSMYVVGGGVKEGGRLELGKGLGLNNGSFISFLIQLCSCCDLHLIYTFSCVLVLTDLLP